MHNVFGMCLVPMQPADPRRYPDHAQVCRSSLFCVGFEATCCFHFAFCRVPASFTRGYSTEGRDTKYFKVSNPKLTPQRMLRAALASGAAALITTPFDVLATRTMTDKSVNPETETGPRSDSCPYPDHYLECDIYPRNPNHHSNHHGHLG